MPSFTANLVSRSCRLFSQQQQQQHKGRLTKVFPVIPTGPPFQSLLEVHYHSTTNKWNFCLHRLNSVWIYRQTRALPHCIAFYFFIRYDFHVLSAVGESHMLLGCSNASEVTAETTTGRKRNLFHFIFLETRFGTNCFKVGRCGFLSACFFFFFRFQKSDVNRRSVYCKY